MKKLLMSFALLCAVFSYSTAQVSAVRAGIAFLANTDDGGTYLGGGIDFETALGRHLSFNGGGDIVTGEITETFFTLGQPVEAVQKVRAINLQPELRYYFKEALTGFFVGLQADVAMMKYTGHPLEPVISYTLIGPGIGLGSTFTANEFLDFSFKVSAGIYEEGVGITGRFRAGYRF